MPYSNPSSPQPLPIHSLGRPNHRRSYSHTPTANSLRGPMFSPERGSGTFAPMGALPRRQKAASSAAPPSNPQSPRGKTKFSLKSSSSSGSSSDTSDDDKVHLGNITPPVVLKQNHSFGLSLNTNLQRLTRNTDMGPLTLKNLNNAGIQRARAGSPVPFPRSSNSPLASPLPAEPGLLSPRPAYARTSSSPIILSNGKPLKSSLKSSSSSPVISHGHHQHVHHTVRPLHLRAQSSPSLHNPPPTAPKLTHHAASNPGVQSPNDPSSSSSSPSSDNEDSEDDHLQYTPPTPKAVHFPTEPTEIASVRLFSKRARPASVSLPSVYLNPNGTDGADTETGSDSDTGLKWGMSTSNGGATGFPFPRSPLSKSHSDVSDVRYVLDEDVTSPMHTSANEVRLEGLWLIHDVDGSSSTVETNPNSAAPGSIVRPESIAKGPKSGIQLHGTLLLKNLAYSKVPAVRFTLDNWDTTSEVSAKWVEGVHVIPEHASGMDSAFAHRLNGIDTHHSAPPTHDRFAFTIRLDDYALGSSLTSRTLWLVARYTAPGVGEWWDNNYGQNYRVGFKQMKTEEKQEKRERSLSAPPVIPASSILFPTAGEMKEAPVAPSTTSESSPKPEEAVPPHMSPPAHPEHAEAIANATTHVLSKLNLKNYASPTTVRARVPSFSSGSPDVPTVSMAPSTNSPGWVSDSTETDITPTRTPAVPAPVPAPGSAAVASLASTLSRFGSVASNHNDSVKLYWPWGTKPGSPVRESSSSPPKLPLEVMEPAKEVEVSIVNEEEDDDNDLPSTMSSSMTSSASDMTSPQPSLTADLDDDDDAEALLSPLSPIDGVSPFGGMHSSAEPTPKASQFEVPPATSNPDDSLYQAFVQQWCFAQGPVVVR